MNLNMIWLFNHLERVTWVPFLTAATTTSLPPQIAPARLLQAIATRRLATVPAVLGQLIPQPLELNRLFRDALLQGQDDRYQGFFVQLLKLAGIKVNLPCHNQPSIPHVR